MESVTAQLQEQIGISLPSPRLPSTPAPLQDTTAVNSTITSRRASAIQSLTTSGGCGGEEEGEFNSCLAVLYGHSGAVECLDFESPLGTLVSGGSDKVFPSLFFLTSVFRQYSAIALLSYLIA